MKIAKLASFKPSRVLYADKELIVEHIQQNPLKQILLKKLTFMHDGDKFIAIKNKKSTNGVFGLITQAGERLVVIYKTPIKFFANTQATINSSKNGKVAYGEINPKLVDKLLAYAKKAHQCLINNVHGTQKNLI